MRIRCRQNAPQRTMRVASKSYSFCFSFRWGFRLQRARAQPAQADRERSKQSRWETRAKSIAPGVKPDRGNACQLIEADQGSPHGPIKPDRAGLDAPSRSARRQSTPGQLAQAHRATRTRQSSQIDQPIDQPWPRTCKLGKHLQAR